MASASANVPLQQLSPDAAPPPRSPSPDSPPPFPFSSLPMPAPAAREHQQKIFKEYRSRLRRSYLMPLVMWIPSFAFVLYFAIVGQLKGTSAYSWGAVALWIVMLVFIAHAYRSRFQRLEKVYALGLLDSLPIDELNDVVMNGAPLRPAPTYDEFAPRYDEPLPPYPLRRTNSTRSTRSTRTMQSLRRWWASGSNNEEATTNAAATTAPAGVGEPPADIATPPSPTTTPSVPKSDQDPDKELFELPRYSVGQAGPSNAGASSSSANAVPPAALT